MGVLSRFLSTFWWFVFIQGAGGGKCPEEEHTTCSGGPTILVTSAVYGEREYFLKYSILENKKKIENNIFYDKNKII